MTLDVADVVASHVNKLLPHGMMQEEQQGLIEP
jgi:hypothetical protein